MLGMSFNQHLKAIYLRQSSDSVGSSFTSTFVFAIIQPLIYLNISLKINLLYSCVYNSKILFFCFSL